MGPTFFKCFLLSLCIELWVFFDVCGVARCGFWAKLRTPLGSEEKRRVVSEGWRCNNSGDEQEWKWNPCQLQIKEARNFSETHSQYSTRMSVQKFLANVLTRQSRTQRTDSMSSLRNAENINDTESMTDEQTDKTYWTVLAYNNP